MRGSGKTDDIDERAATWAIRCAEGPLNDASQRELDEWLASDTRHLGAWVRAQAMWLDIDRLVALDAGEKLDLAPVATARPILWRTIAIAAALLLVIGLSLIAHNYLAGRIATERGEVRQIALDDGSTLFLNGGSVVQVRYRAGQRRVILRKGEASFRVAHDTARPFIVEAGGVRVRAVGTEFSVGMDQHRDVSVLVSEGVVRVADDRGAAEVRQTLRRNDQLVAVGTGIRRDRLEPAEISRRLAWRQGLLVFRGQMLADAAAEVNRYAAKPVVINDPTLGRAEFLGVFKIGDSRAFAEGAAAAFNGEVSETPDQIVLMRRQSSPSH